MQQSERRDDAVLLPCCYGALQGMGTCTWRLVWAGRYFPAGPGRGGGCLGGCRLVIEVPWLRLDLELEDLSGSGKSTTTVDCNCRKPRFILDGEGGRPTRVPRPIAKMRETDLGPATRHVTSSNGRRRSAGRSPDGRQQRRRCRRAAVPASRRRRRRSWRAAAREQSLCSRRTAQPRLRLWPGSATETSRRGRMP